MAGQCVRLLYLERDNGKRLWQTNKKFFIDIKMILNENWKIGGKNLQNFGFASFRFFYFQTRQRRLLPLISFHQY